MTDEQRADSVDGYGARYGACPFLSSIGGAAFSQAVTPSPMCVPARTSQLTGLLPAATGVYRNRRTNEDPPAPVDASLVRWLESEGYRSISLGKQHYSLQSPAFETEETFVLSDLVGYTSYRDEIAHGDSLGVQFPGPTKWIMAGEFPGAVEETAEWRLVERAFDIVRGLDRSRPNLLRLSFNAPHTPVIPPGQYVDKIPNEVAAPAAFLAVDPDWPTWLDLLQGTYANAGLLSEGQLAVMRRYYFAWCRFVDDMIARFSDMLRSEDLLEDAVFVVGSDHGAHLGDHGLVQKQSFFTESVTVPYRLVAPDLEDQRIDEPVSSMTLLPTAAGLAGLTPPDRYSSLDLSPLLRGRGGTWPRFVVSQARLNPPQLDYDNRIVMVQMDGMRGVFDIDAPEERELLFDLEHDPHELSSCDAHSKHAETLSRLRSIARASVSQA